ncbi:uncharacterized protein LOC130743489 [Lotus japonicus]|uniref:uncharacterized protein LOC130743489 n=1 Tax=Lotus japonicus TaxID=34305 RepID=UPI00258707CE|nr:uncharacterized protein LOC130743489 [Lotus japonicus]
MPEKREGESHEEQMDRPSTEIMWTKPDPGILKINVDARWSGEQGQGYGLVVRDHDGECAYAATSYSTVRMPALIAEAQAVRWAIQEALSLDMDSVVVESDSLEFISCFVFISKSMTSLLPILVLLSSTTYSAHPGSENPIKSATFLSEKFEIGPGRIVEKAFIDIDFPRGHIGVKSFDAELVDEEGNSVPLHEAYLHHYFILKYLAKKNVSRDPKEHFVGSIPVRNAGTCNGNILSYFWAKGAESRGTPSNLLDPFALELGNPASIPSGYEEKWLTNIMTIDTRGAINKESCTQCTCEAYHLPKDFYNTTRDFKGKLLTPTYKGGLFCCQNGFQCKLEKGFQAPTRKFALRYNITWVDWNEFQVPVKFYVLDVTDRVTRNGSQTIHDCQIDYSIPATNDGSKYHVAKADIPIEKGGYLIYCTSHMHAGVVNATLYGQDGRALCTSTPKYGTGMEPGNEKGYAVGMSVTYPEPGSIKIKDGETLTLESRYESGFRTGVMGQMYIYTAEKLPQ